MRIDHFAYQRATKVAGFGLLVQIAIGLLLLIFGRLSGDKPFMFASMYVLPGVLVWLGLVIVFHQHKLERLEALEEDELAASRGESAFDKSRAETGVAARRLGLMHTWFLPGLSLFLAVVLGILASVMLGVMRGLKPGDDFQLTEQRGWAIALCLSIAALSFIFSRFVAGMAKQQAWANLRGGAAYMVGNALVMVAVAAGIVFRFFDNDAVIKAVAWAIPIIMCLQVVEIVLNFILNLYRPRIPGEVPRPAFDSKVLSWFASPDSIVRSLNEAVNYQFGFDVTSSWGYQLLLRSFVWLLVLGIGALVVLSTMVVVEPHQQALRLRGGALVRDANGQDRVYGSGIMWKWPWPIESAAVYDVSRLRNLWLTAKTIKPRDVNMWTGDPPQTDATITSFLVASPIEQRMQNLAKVLPGGAVLSQLPPATGPADSNEDAANPESQQPSAEDEAAQAVSAMYSLVDAELVLQYRIKSTNNGLLDYLRFGSDEIERLEKLTERERALRDIALAVVSSQLSQLSIDEVLSPGRSDLSVNLAGKIQTALDERAAGVEVVALEIPMLRPSGNSAEKFEELNIGVQASQEYEAKETNSISQNYTYLVGDAALADRVIKAIDEFYDLRAAGAQAQALEKRQQIEKLLAQGGGQAAQRIADAERERWVTLMKRRAEAAIVSSQLAAYRAAPRLFRQRELMRVYSEVLPTIDKYLLALDPRRVHVDMDLKKLNLIQSFAGVSEEEAQHK